MFENLPILPLARIKKNLHQHPLAGKRFLVLGKTEQRLECIAVIDIINSAVIFINSQDLETIPSDEI